MLTTLYKSIVRPHLENGSNIWSVMYKKEAIQIENVQRRATKLVKNIQHLSYSDRSRYLGLPSLQYRRLRSDMVETFRIINNIDKVDVNLKFKFFIYNDTKIFLFCGLDDDIPSHLIFIIIGRAEMCMFAFRFVES
jgi:hypothetical protein